MSNVTIPFDASPQRAGIPPTEVVHALTREDLVAYTWYLWKSAPERLPTFLRRFLWLIAIEFFCWIPLVIVAALGGIAVAVYFIARSACSPQSQEAGVPSNIMWAYIVGMSLILIVGFRRGGFLWRLLDKPYRKIIGLMTLKHGRRSAGLDKYDPLLTYRLALTSSGFTRIVDQRENVGGIENYLRRTEAAPWSIVSAIMANAAHLFFFIKDDQRAFIVPARAFADTAAFTAFVEEARRLHLRAVSPQGSPVAGIDEQQPDATGGATTAVRSTGIMVYVESIRPKSAG